RAVCCPHRTGTRVSSPYPPLGVPRAVACEPVYAVGQDCRCGPVNPAVASALPALRGPAHGGTGVNIEARRRRLLASLGPGVLLGALASCHYGSNYRLPTIDVPNAIAI